MRINAPAPSVGRHALPATSAPSPAAGCGRDNRDMADCAPPSNPACVPNSRVPRPADDRIPKSFPFAQTALPSRRAPPRAASPRRQDDRSVDTPAPPNRSCCSRPVRARAAARISDRSRRLSRSGAAKKTLRIEHPLVNHAHRRLAVGGANDHRPDAFERLRAQAPVALRPDVVKEAVILRPHVRSDKFPQTIRSVAPRPRILAQPFRPARGELA